MLTGTTTHTHVTNTKSMINTEKVLKEMAKGTSDNMIVVMELIKAQIIAKLTAEQAEADELASKKQSQIERLNNSN